ncbi:MAG: molybdopterin-binding protein [Caulobacteraceae bacterium]
MSLFSRRSLIGAGAAGGGLMLAACDRLASAPTAQSFFRASEAPTLAAQRLLLAGQPLAREYRADQVSPIFKVNGTSQPGDPAYKAHADAKFADWRLAVDGLVRRPSQFSLAQLRAMPARSQITRHDCVEGWSAIGGWTGVPLAHLLRLVGLMPNARYVVFRCADDLDNSTDGSGQYYESLDLFDAFHPQTILAYAMNGAPLSIGHGAPLRLRVERQLGYKHAKYVMRIQLADRLDTLRGGHGGYWEDRGYAWYGGI